jgi:hypothetical protein
MNAITVTSEHARINWRDTIDAAYQGNQVVIERYGKPMVTVVNYATLQHMTAELARLRRIVQADQQFAAMAAGDVMEFDYSQAPSA